MSRFATARALGLHVLMAAMLVCPAVSRADNLASIIQAYEALASQLDGNRGQDWPDVSPGAVAKRAAGYHSLRSRLSRLPPVAGRAVDDETQALLAWKLDVLIEGIRFDEERIPFDNGDGFFNTANYAAAQTVLRDETDARAWIDRLERLPAYYDAQIENMRRGLRSGFTQPRSVASGVLDILRSAASQPVESSPVLSPFEHFPATVSAEQAGALRARASAVVRDRVKPAQEKMVRFFADEYVPGARTSTGARSLPDGEAYYPFLIRRSTTLPLSPEEVEKLGRDEVQRLSGEMEAAMRATGWQGSLQEFMAMLRTDPRFYAKDLPTYVEKGSEVGKRVDALLPRWFGKLPRLTWGIRRKPPEAEATSSGYDLGDPEKGVSGSVVIGSKSYLEPLFSLPSWILHEGVPGHHLQIALAQERLDLPPFRRKDDITAFVEGWALYSEQLGEEMGVYRDPYEHFGRLAFNIWRACRLVMDVGIHWHGQAPSEAERCLLDHTTLPRGTADYETARYTAWPAQALAYKIGELRIIEIRRRAEAALGPRFDLRAFHDQLLDDGPVPLTLLEKRMDRWVRERQKPKGH